MIVSSKCHSPQLESNIEQINSIPCSSVKIFRSRHYYHVGITSGGARALKLGGGQSRGVRGHAPAGKFWNLESLKCNFLDFPGSNEVNSQDHKATWTHNFSYNSTRVLVRPGYIDKSYRTPPPPLFLTGFRRSRKLVSVRNGGGGGDESPPVHPVAPLLGITQNTMITCQSKRVWTNIENIVLRDPLKRYSYCTGCLRNTKKFVFIIRCEHRFNWIFIISLRSILGNCSLKVANWENRVQRDIFYCS